MQFVLIINENTEEFNFPNKETTRPKSHWKTTIEDGD